MAVCSEIHTKHINTVCGQNVELLNVKLAVHRGFKEILLLPKYHSVDQMKKDKMGCVCGLYGAEQKYIQNVGEDT